jgi:hypothetical protein
MASHPFTIRFAGICTHFRDVVPGVPHRVVLADATAFRFGRVQLEWSGETKAFYLIPHFPFLRTPKNVDQLVVPEVMTGGYLYGGSRMQIANAVGEGLTYETFDETPSILGFVPEYAYSEDVVVGGRAACYFDLFKGKVQTETLVNGVTRVLIVVETDGPPVLEVTPFAPGARPTLLTLDAEELLVANLEVDRADDDPHFDYLLHYLTARTGIPTLLSQPTPGMGLTPPSHTQETVSRAMAGLARVIASGRPSPEELAGIRPNDVTPSCADSRYP